MANFATVWKAIGYRIIENGICMPKIAIEVESSDNVALRKIIEQLKTQVKENRDLYSERMHENRLKQLAPGNEPFVPNAKIMSVLNLGIHSMVQLEIAGLETMDDLLKMDRKHLMKINKVGHTVVNEIETFIWTVYGKRLPKDLKK